MAKSSTSFKIGNPGGRPLPEDIKQVLKLSRTEVVDIFYKLMGLSIHELEDLLNNKRLTVAEHWIARVALLGIKNGDQIRLEFFLVKLFGKAISEPRTIEHDDPSLLREIPSSEIIKLIKARDDQRN